MSDRVLPRVNQQTVDSVFEALSASGVDYDPNSFIDMVQDENPILYERINAMLMDVPEGEIRVDVEMSLFLLYMLLRAQAVSDQSLV